MDQEGPAATVLHVEDDEALRHLIEGIFEDEAARLDYVGAAGGDEALELLADVTGPVLLLVDRQLPGTDLWSFVEEVEERLSVVAVPTFVLSGSEDPKAIAEAYANGAAAYLEKPMDADGFYDIVDFLDRYVKVATLPGPTT